MHAFGKDDLTEELTEIRQKNFIRYDRKLELHTTPCPTEELRMTPCPTEELRTTPWTPHYA